MDEIEAGANLIRALDHHFPIKVAFWLKRDDEDPRYLYISSDRFDRANRLLAYEEVSQITREKPSLFLDPSRVSLISGEDRFAVAAMRIKEKSSDRLGARLGSERFGDQYIADGYIYPMPLPNNFPRF